MLNRQREFTLSHPTVTRFTYFNTACLCRTGPGVVAPLPARSDAEVMRDAMREATRELRGAR